MHCGCLTLETLYLNNIIHQSGIRIWWCFPLKKKHDFKWRRSDLTIVGTPHQVAGQQDLPWNIQLMPILFDDKHVDLPVYIYIHICGEDFLGLFRSYAHMSTRVLSCTGTYIYIYTYVERTFWVYFVPTLICPHACFLAHVHIYIYIYIYTYIYIHIYIYIYVERTFWVYFVPTLICPHACFLAHVHIYIYICGEVLLGLFRSYAHMSTRVLSCTRTYIYIYICSKNGHEPVRKLLNHPRVRVPSSRFENKLLIWFGNTKHLRVVGQKTWPSPWNHWGGPLQIPQNNGKSTSKLYKLGWITMFMGTWRV